MKATIKSLAMTFFKGCQEAKHSFSDRTIITGQNGIGKTTIADAWYFLISNKNYALSDNPNIRPADAGDEIIPVVEATLDVDGKPITISKSQKLKRSGEKVSLTNSYTINEVPKSERDFKSYLTECGFDFDKLMPLSHPNVFLAGISNKKERDAMRNTLFGMAEKFSDLDIAKKSKDTKTVAKLLKDYTVEEIEAMQTATLRKIRENYGKDGEILRAQIQGKLELKVEDNSAELLAEKKITEKELAEISKQYEAIRKTSDKADALRSEIMDLKFDLSEAHRSANANIADERTKKRRNLDDALQRLADCKNTITGLQTKIEADKMLQTEINKMGKEKMKEKEAISNREFPNAVCPTCGQEYPADRLKAIQKAFDERKMADIASCDEKIENLRFQFNTAKSRIKTAQESVKEEKKRMKALEDAVKLAESAIDDVTEIKMEDVPECKVILKKIKTKETQLEKLSIDDPEALDGKRDYLMEKLNSIEAELSKLERNKAIDDQVEELHKKQIEYEQAKADAEKIQYELSLLSKLKNELLEESVNSHFDIVKWKLFDQRKNGEYFDTCIPMIDGKRFGESMNTGLETLARIDIINGLQKYYKQYYPVFLDGAEHLSSNTDKLIKLTSQLIELKVTEDKELKVG